MSDKLRFYPEEKTDALAAFLGVPPGSIRVWSDNSLTVDGIDGEYWVTSWPREYGRIVGKSNGYIITISSVLPSKKELIINGKE